MAKLTRKALLDGAGKLYSLRRELTAARRELGRLTGHVEALEKKAKAAEQEYNLMFERLQAEGPPVAGTASDLAPLAKGKLPDRVLHLMKADPTRNYFAPEIADKLKIKDVQQVRTALARLADKGYVRRAGSKGEYTI